MIKLTYILIISSLASCVQGGSDTSSAGNLNSTIDTFPSVGGDSFEQIGSKTGTGSNKKTRIGNRREIAPDFFQIPGLAFSEFKSDNSRWFIGSNGEDQLYLVPYTDYTITTAILTKEGLHDPVLIGLLESEGIRITDTGKAIGIGEIESESGIRIGLAPNETKYLFGEPDSTITIGNQERLFWYFSMLEKDTDVKFGGLKPFILDGLEFNAEMTFKDDKLTKAVYKYGVP